MRHAITLLLDYFEYYDLYMEVGLNLGINKGKSFEEVYQKREITQMEAILKRLK